MGVAVGVDVASDTSGVFVGTGVDVFVLSAVAVGVGSPAVGVGSPVSVGLSVSPAISVGSGDSSAGFVASGVPVSDTGNGSCEGFESFLNISIAKNANTTTMIPIHTPHVY